MSEPASGLSDRFIMRAGKRGSLTLWVLALAVLWFSFAIALANAIAQRTTGDAGGVGHVFIPVAGVSFTALLLCVMVARWWEDETEFRVAGDRLEVRHGVGPFHWPAVRMDAREPVVFTGDDGRGSYRVYVQQGGKRVLLGTTEAIVPLQYSNWTRWAHQHGITVEQHWDVAER